MQVSEGTDGAGAVPGGESPRTDVLGWILAQSRVQPDRPAAEDLAQRLTYAELCQRAEHVAGELAGRGVREGDRVALYLPNSVDFVLVALACLWIGALFVPLAVTDPEARLGALLDDCAPRLVVAGARSEDQPHFPDSLSRHASVEVADLLASAAGRPAPVVSERPDRLAYAIYTSGTTGTPKGVLIASSAFAAAVRAIADAVGMDPHTRALCVSPFHFDGSFGTLFPVLARGGSLVIRPRERLLFPRVFFNAVASEGITYVGFSPSYLRLLVSSGQLSRLAGTSLVTMALGGEAASSSDIRSLWAAVPAIRVFNRYGPTETAIAVTDLELTPEMLAGGSVPVGRPHEGVRFYLVDEQGQLVQGAGRIGELYIGGAQLMAGYWGAPELTAQVLRDDAVTGETVYKTGDLMLRDEAGNYLYFDRADRVIKRSGVRISLVELAEVLTALPGVTSAVCAPFDNEGQLGIVAFVVADGGLSANDLQKQARARLPATMLPDRVEVVDSLPLTGSGKVDERVLLATAGLQPSPRVGASA